MTQEEFINMLEILPVTPDDLQEITQLAAECWKDYNMEDKIMKAHSALKNADTILIGTSNGLSISEGYNIFADNEMFRRQFGDFKERYGIKSILDGIFVKHMAADDYKNFVRGW